MAERQRQAAGLRQCIICAEEKPIYTGFTTFSACNHGADVCQRCYGRQALAIIDADRSRGWDSVITCPQCTATLSPHELQASLPREIVRDIHLMITRHRETENEAWRWCLNVGCGGGVIHDQETPVVTCPKCSSETCFRHQTPWHTGSTCDEYDIAHPANAVTTKENVDAIKRYTKACPSCGVRVQKNVGCMHIKCPRCTWDWWWNEVKFDGEDEPSAADYAGGPGPPQDNGVAQPAVAPRLLPQTDDDEDDDVQELRSAADGLVTTTYIMEARTNRHVAARRRQLDGQVPFGGLRLPTPHPFQDQEDMEQGDTAQAGNSLDELD